MIVQGIVAVFRPTAPHFRRRAEASFRRRRQLRHGGVPTFQLRHNLPFAVVVHAGQEAEHGPEAVAEFGVHPAVDEGVVDAVTHGGQENCQVDELDVRVVEDVLVDFPEQC